MEKTQIISDTIKIVEDGNNTNLEKKAQMYMDIFWEEPRNEWYQCQGECNELYALSKVKSEELTQCLNCGSPIEPFYEKNDLQSKWKSRSEKEWYIWMLSETLEWNELVWFIMGWGTSLDTLNNEKLWLDEENLEQLNKNMIALFPECDANNLFYAADIGVKKEYRSKEKPGIHIASKLYDAREKEVKNKWFGYVIVRTTKKSDVPYKRYKGKWFKDVFDYNDAQDRVVLIKEI